MTKKNQNRIKGTVTSMSFGGRGILKQDGKVFFIPNAIPGEQVEAEVIRDKNSWAETKKIATTNSSPFHRPALCPYFQSCGGCQWLNALYSQQLLWKKDFILSAFKKIAHHTLEDLEMMSSPQEFNYRNRSTFRIIATKPQISLGFLREKSHDTVPIKQCKIAESPINQFLNQASQTAVDLHKPKLFSLEVQALSDSKVIITLKHAKKAIKSDISKFAATLARIPVVSAVGISGHMHHQHFIYDRQFSINYWTSHDQFQQVNIPANHRLRQLVKDIVDSYQPETILDLFCGSGNLSLHLIRAGRYILGIESHPASIVTAKKNIQDNALQNIDYRCQTSSDYLLSPTIKSPDLLLLDPPRQGVGSAMGDLIAIDPKTVVYISCDPNTLAKDCYKLLGAGYQMKQVVGMDFFPNTYHIESLVVLEKSSRTC